MHAATGPSEGFASYVSYCHWSTRAPLSEGKLASSAAGRRWTSRAPRRRFPSRRRWVPVAYLDMGYRDIKLAF